LIISGQGGCAPPDVFLIIAHTATVSTIVTDMALVVVPALILWNTQMKRQSKIQAFALLSFASLYEAPQEPIALSQADNHTGHQSLPWSASPTSTNLNLR
jgi:hypothetical protein